MADPSPEEVAVTKALAAINWGGCEGYEPACVPEHCQCRQAARAAIQAYRSVRPINQGETTMTTTVKVHVNGKYRATVTQDDREPVTVEGNYNGGSGEKAFYLSHPANSTFVVTEAYVEDGDERPAE